MVLLNKSLYDGRLVDQIRLPQFFFVPKCDLPANLTDKKFRDHFSTKGQVTDSKIIRTA
ncbi:10750_t:CDS:2, partial [Racocetra persica]